MEQLRFRCSSLVLEKEVMQETIKTISPIDQQVYVERTLATQQQIDTTLDTSVEAQSSWGKTEISERKRICRQMVKYMEDHAQEIGLEIAHMMGRPIRYARGEVAGLAERAHAMIEMAESALAPIQLQEKPGFIRYIKRDPIGTCFIIAPWNYPYLTAVNAIVPAIMAGNSVILKHSAQTPLVAERFAAAFEVAGLPEGVFQYLHLSHENTQRMIQDYRVDYVAFTGSVPGGQMVEEAAAGRFIGLGLELGGKDPAYIREDADLDAAVETVIDGAFFNSGQSCCGIERIYVHEKQYEAFLEKATALIYEYRLGRSDDPEVTLGPMVRASAADFVRKQIKEAVAQGAVTHIDPSRFPFDESGTPYMAPQLLSHVDHQMRVMTEESFGPVVGVMKVANDEEAVALMNDSEFGLTASIFTRDIEHGIQLGEKVQTGTFFINRCDYLDPELAWTGVKNSGKGCTLSKHGYDALTRLKSFHVKQPEVK